jgi:hypothetical protein
MLLIFLLHLCIDTVNEVIVGIGMHHKVPHHWAIETSVGEHGISTTAVIRRDVTECYCPAVHVGTSYIAACVVKWHERKISQKSPRQSRIKENCWACIQQFSVVLVFLTQLGCQYP